VSTILSKLHIPDLNVPQPVMTKHQDFIHPITYSESRCIFALHAVNCF